MSVLSDVYFKAYREGGGGSPRYHIPSHEKALRAVAEEAIAADRAARAEPVAYQVRRASGYNHFIDAVDTEMLELARLSEYAVDPLYTAPPVVPVVPDGYAVVHAAELLAELRKILGVDGTVYQRVRAMLAAAPAPSQEPTT